MAWPHSLCPLVKGRVVGWRYDDWLGLEENRSLRGEYWESNVNGLTFVSLCMGT